MRGGVIDEPSHINIIAIEINMAVCSEIRESYFGGAVTFFKISVQLIGRLRAETDVNA